VLLVQLARLEQREKLEQLDPLEQREKLEQLARLEQREKLEQQEPLERLEKQVLLALLALLGKQRGEHFTLTLWPYPILPVITSH
jgi:hypothetical protein